MADAARVAAAAEAACSPLYRPPELYEPPHRGQLDGRADVWALGCVLYFLMMCINPFERACQQGASLVLAVQRRAPALPPHPAARAQRSSVLLVAICDSLSYGSRVSGKAVVVCYGWSPRARAGRQCQVLRSAVLRSGVCRVLTCPLLVPVPTGSLLPPSQS